MNEEKDVDYYFEKLKVKGLDRDKYYSQSLSPIHKYNVFPDEKVFMNWLVDGDFLDLRSMNDIIFAIYSNPSSEENIVINRYIKEENKQQEISKLSDECTENVLYLLKVLTNLKGYSTEDLIKIHEETLEKIDKMKERLNNIISGAFEYFKKKEKQSNKEQYIG
ncbi:hypothetical protein M1384_02650 [Candidatus Parvarchaeota archaeon]|jgi:hypothetical protein|nr:hypothetical protein [Candidatus Parvarchaeota archaeon]